MVVVVILAVAVAAAEVAAIKATVAEAAAAAATTECNQRQLRVSKIEQTAHLLQHTKLRRDRFKRTSNLYPYVALVCLATVSAVPVEDLPVGVDTPHANRSHRHVCQAAVNDLHPLLPSHGRHANGEYDEQAHDGRKDS